MRRHLIALLPAIVLPALCAVGSFVIGSGPAAQLGYLAAKLFTLLWPLIAWHFLLGGLPKPAWRDRRHRRALPLGLITGLAIGGAMLALLWTPLGEMLQEQAPLLVGKIHDLGIAEHFLLFAGFIALLHSGIEEYYWRGFVYGELRQLCPGWRAHGIAGAAFALHHVVVLTQYLPLLWALIFGAAVGVGGVIWSLLYQRQGSLVGAWLSHALVDVVIMAIGYALLVGAC